LQLLFFFGLRASPPVSLVKVSRARSAARSRRFCECHGLPVLIVNTYSPAGFIIGPLMPGIPDGSSICAIDNLLGCRIRLINLFRRCLAGYYGDYQISVRVDRTRMTRITRIIADKTKKDQRQSALSVSSAFYQPVH